MIRYDRMQHADCSDRSDEDDFSAFDHARSCGPVRVGYRQRHERTVASLLCCVKARFSERGENPIANGVSPEIRDRNRVLLPSRRPLRRDSCPGRNGRS
jgi:hypothetical protein